MTVLMFWNIGGNANFAAIGQLCRDYQVDILLLAEAGKVPPALAAEINSAAKLTGTFSELPRLGSRIRAFTRYAPGFLEPAFDDTHVKMLHLQPPIGLPLLIVAAHPPSKLRAGGDDQGYRIRRLRTDIEAQEKRSGHQNIVVIGDLNVNPFEDALTAADGLHGVMARELAIRPARTVQGKAWDYFYNPMWSRLGDESTGPPGTYWYADSGVVNHFWNTFDQVLLRPALLPHFDPARLLVLEKVGEQTILKQGRTAGGLSDHLPLVLDLPIEKGLSDG